METFALDASYQQYQSTKLYLNYYYIWIKYINTILSLIVPPPYFFTKKYTMICSKFEFFFHLKQHNFINGTQNMQFYSIICWYLHIFFSKVWIKIYHFNTFNYGSISKFGLGPRATIWDNTVLHNASKNCKI